jgi:hypothetical protein
MTPQQQLQKLMDDKSFDLVQVNKFGHGVHYEFKGQVRETPQARKHDVFNITIYDQKAEEYLRRPQWYEDKASKVTRTEQKFLCVNGPLQGQSVVECEAEGYSRFNRSTWSSRRGGAKPVRVVLVHGV